MKIVVIGRETMIKRIKLLMAEHGVEVKGASGRLEEISLLHQQNGAVLAVVDTVAQEAEAACHYITESWCIPLVLIVDDMHINWRKLNSFNASGYIAETSGDTELVSRLNAMVRRFWPLLAKKYDTSHTAKDHELGGGEAIPDNTESVEEVAG